MRVNGCDDPASMLDQATLDLIQAGSIVFASLMAVYGIAAWRREHTGKKKIDLAEEVLGLFYQAQYTINNYIRDSLTTSGDGSTRPIGDEAEPEWVKKARNQYFVPVERHQQQGELFGRIHSIRFRFMAAFGKEKAEPFNELSMVIKTIYAASIELRLGVSDSPEQLSAPSVKSAEKDKTRTEELKRTIWAGLKKDDPTANELDQIIQKVEGTCRPVLEGGIRWWHKLKTNVVTAVFITVLVIVALIVGM